MNCQRTEIIYMQCPSSDHVFSTMVGPDGFEPSTSRLSSVCSNQLSYEPDIGYQIDVLS